MVDPFRKAEVEFLRLKSKLAVGRITSEEFDAAIKQLTVRDLRGRVWVINPETGNWKVRDESGPGPSTVPERMRVKYRAPRRRNRALILGAIAVSTLIVVAAVGLIVFSSRPVVETSLNIAATPTAVVVSALAIAPTTTPLPTPTFTPTAVPTDTPMPTPTQTATPIPPTATLLAPKDMVQYVNPRKYRVEFAFAATSSGVDASELRVYQARPLDWDEQRVQIEEVSPAPSREVVDSGLGNSVYYWQLNGQPASGASATFKIQFLLTAYETRTNIDPAVIRPYTTTNPLVPLYTRSERFIESDDPQIVQLADQIAGTEADPYRLARKFYDYVVDRAQSKPTGRGLIGAKALLAAGTGESADYAALFVALARAKGIPARPIVGYWAKSGLDQTHVWGEFYLEPIGWIPVDPTVGQAQPLNRNYYFGNLDNERVILHKNYNLPLEPPLPNNDLVPILQSPAWGVSGQGDVNALQMDRTSWTVTRVP